MWGGGSGSQEMGGGRVRGDPGRRCWGGGQGQEEMGEEGWEEMGEEGREEMGEEMGGGDAGRRWGAGEEKEREGEEEREWGWQFRPRTKGSRRRRPACLQSVGWSASGSAGGWGRGGMKSLALLVALTWRHQRGCVSSRR